MKDVIDVWPGNEPEPHLVVVAQRAGEPLGHRFELYDPKVVWEMIDKLRDGANMLWGNRT